MLINSLVADMCGHHSFKVGGMDRYHSGELNNFVLQITNIKDKGMNKNRLIYCLRCPITKSIHYIGESNNGLIRPLQLLTKSHSDKVKEWVEELKVFGYKPIIEVLEYVPNEKSLEQRKRFFIYKELESGGLLLNSNLVSPFLISSKYDKELQEGSCDSIDHISRFVKERRKSIGISQEDFASKIGISVSVLRKIEQGKTNVSLDSLLIILSMFGARLDYSKKGKLWEK